jgi:hypothetical protein
VKALAIDPTSSTTMYAGGVAGGVWKTTNGGTSWAPLTDSSANLAVSSIVISPADHNVIYAGTGEHQGSYHFPVPGAGIMKSTNAGLTWSFIANTFDLANKDNFITVRRLAISDDGTRLYAASNKGVMRSLDSGVTWSPARTTTDAYDDGCTDVDIVSTDTAPNPDLDTLVAACGSVLPGGIYRSTDSGANWSARVNGTNWPATPFGTADLSVSPNHLRVWASLAGSGHLADDSAANPGADQFVGLLRSDNGGDTWTRVATAPDVFANCSFPLGGKQGNYDNVVAVDPVDPDRVWIGGIDLYVYTTASNAIRRVSSWFLDQTTRGLTPQHLERWVHADQHTVVFDPNYATSHVVYIGNDGGIFRTANGNAAVSSNVTCDGTNTNPAGPMTWTDLDNGLGITQFYDGVPEPQGGGYFGGTQDNGAWYGVQVDGTNAWSMVHGGDGGTVGVEPDAAVKAYYTQFPLMDFARVSANRQTVTRAVIGPTELYADPDNDPTTAAVPNDRWRFVNPFIVDPNATAAGVPRRLWTGGDGIWTSVNQGSNWTRVVADIDGTPNSGLVTALAVKPGNSNVVYVGMDDGRVWRSANATNPAPTFTQVDSTNLPPTSFANTVSSIAISADGRVWVAYQRFKNSYIMKSDLAGTTFVDSDPDINLPVIPFNAVAVNPLHANEIYLGTDAGVYQSNDTGATWTLATKNLANTIVPSLKFQPGTEILYAFTHGRGAWRVKAGPQADVTRPTYSTSLSLAGTATFTFSEDVTGITSNSMFLRLGDTGVKVPGSITSCKNASGTVVACASTTVRSATYTTTSKLVLGQKYQTVATAAVQDSYGNDVSSAIHNIRVTTEQDNGATPVYQWRNLASSSSYGGYTRVAAMAGETLNFVTTSRSVVWYTIKGPSQGLADVYVNNVKVLADVTNRSTTSTYKVARTIPFANVPTASSYTVSIRAKGPSSGTDTSKTRVNVDAFKVGTTLVSNPTTNVTYRWRGVTYTSGRHTYATDMTSAVMTLPFRGTALSLKVVTGATQGKMRVKIDGTTYPDIDLYASSTHYDVAKNFSSLTDTVHTLTLTVLGTKNASATATQVTVDSFTVT